MPSGMYHHFSKKTMLIHVYGITIGRASRARGLLVLLAGWYGILLHVYTEVFAPLLRWGKGGGTFSHLDKRLVCCCSATQRNTWKEAWDLTRWDNPNKGTFFL